MARGTKETWVRRLIKNEKPNQRNVYHRSSGAARKEEIGAGWERKMRGLLTEEGKGHPPGVLQEVKNRRFKEDRRVVVKRGRDQLNGWK